MIYPAKTEKERRNIQRAVNHLGFKVVALKRFLLIPEIKRKGAK